MDKRLRSLLEIEDQLGSLLHDVRQLIQDEIARQCNAGEAMIVPGGRIVYLADDDQIERGKADELARHGGEP